MGDIADALFGAAASSSSHAAASAAAAAAAAASQKVTVSAVSAVPRSSSQPTPTIAAQGPSAATSSVMSQRATPPVSPLAALAGPGTARRPTAEDLEYMARAVGQRSGMAQVPAARAMMQL